MTFKYHEQETEFTCGPAVMRMVLSNHGIDKREKEVAKILRTNKVRGTYLRELPRLAEKYRLSYVVKRNSDINDLRVLDKLNFTIIVCFFDMKSKEGHFAVLKKITKNNIYFWDPYWGPHRKFSLVYFNRIWWLGPSDEPDRRWLFAIKK